MPPAPDKQKQTLGGPEEGSGAHLPYALPEVACRVPGQLPGWCSFAGPVQRPSGTPPRVRMRPSVPYSPPVCWVWSLAPHGDVQQLLDHLVMGAVEGQPVHLHAHVA